MDFIYFRKDDQDSGGKRSAKKKIKRKTEAVGTHSFKKLDELIFYSLF